MTHDKLDTLLKQWASGHVIDDAHARRLADRIAEELARPGDPGAEWSGERLGGMPRRRRSVYAAAVAAAALFVAVITVPFWSPWRPAGKTEVGLSPEKAGVSPVAPIRQPEIEANARLFSEMEKVFGDQLRWVADSETGVRLDVRPVSGGPITAATPLLIRVVVMEKKNNEGAWRTLLETNVLARSEELVEVAPDPKHDNRLVLWGYPLPDGKINVDASIRLSMPIRVDVDVTNIVDPGEPKGIFSLRTADAEYRVYELVTPLPKHTDASCSRT